MENTQEILEEFGKRIQRCYGASSLITLRTCISVRTSRFSARHCRDETMFDFNEFSHLMDITKLKEVAEDHHH